MSYCVLTRFSQATESDHRHLLCTLEPTLLKIKWLLLWWILQSDKPSNQFEGLSDFIQTSWIIFPLLTCSNTPTQPCVYSSCRVIYSLNTCSGDRGHFKQKQQQSEMDSSKKPTSVLTPHTHTQYTTHDLSCCLSSWAHGTKKTHQMKPRYQSEAETQRREKLKLCLTTVKSCRRCC